MEKDWIFLLKNFFKNLLRRLVRNSRVSRSIRVGGNNYKIFLTPDSQLKYMFGPVDKELKSFVSDYISATDNILDVGANCGTFGLYSLAAGCSYVEFFEPDLFLANLIDRSVKYNAAFSNRCVISTFAVSREHEVRKFLIANNGRASNSLTEYGRETQGGARNHANARCFSLDTIMPVLPPITVIKIDVEGAEFEVIAGAAAILERWKPKVLIEIGSGELTKIATFMDQFGYTYTELWPQNYFFTLKKSEGVSI